MKKIRIAFIIALVTLLSSYNFYGQSKFSLDLNKPLPMGDIKDAEIKGIGDLGLRFTLFSITKLDVGLGINTGYFKQEGIDTGGLFPELEADMNTVAVRSKIVAQMKVLKFEPYLGVGYGFFATWVPDFPAVAGNDGGMNVSLGVKIFPIPKLYANIGYDSTSFSDSDSNFNFLNLGIGIEL